MHTSGFLKKLPGGEKIRSYSIFILLSTVLSLPVFTASGQGLLVIPRRVVFEGSKRTQELNLANSGNDTAKYTISLVEIKMKDDGTFEEITVPDSGQNFATGFLRIFPRTVTLGPNEAQTVKVQLININKLAPGEYRSHIYFKALPKEKPKGSPHLKKMVTNLSLKLTPVFGVAIPVLIRVGAYACNVSLSDLSFEMREERPVLNLTFNRTGPMSSYGDMKIDHVSAENIRTNVALVKGFSVYTPNNIRKVQVKLKQSATIKYSTGKLQISYTSQAKDSITTLAEAELPLN